MKTTYKWLCEFVDIDLPPSELASLLTMAGVEVGLYYNVSNEGYDDVVFELDITPNRPDCLSTYGIAREIAAITGKDVKPIPMVIDEEGQLTDNKIDVVIEDPERCPRYTARIVEDVTIGPSPVWLRRRLEAIGMRAINNIVDITNYVLFETGQPLHAFDYELLEGHRIVVQTGRNDKRFLAIDGNEYGVNSNDLFICDGIKSVALAGIIGGRNTEVNNTTRNILIESAYFDPVTIRKTSKRIGLMTESSYRFERGVDTDQVPFACSRAACLMARIAGGKVLKGIIDCYPRPIAGKTIHFRLDKVNRLIGIKLQKDEVKGILSGLGMDVIDKDNQMIDVSPPSYRVDIEGEVDIIEEIARIKGYENIPTTLPSRPPPEKGLNKEIKARQRMAEILSASGFYEVINYSFVSPEHLKAFAKKDERWVNLTNPLTREQSVLRTSLVPGLLENAIYNINHYHHDIRLFEIGNVFIQPQEGETPRELMKVAGIVNGYEKRGVWKAQGRALDIFDVKGSVENLLEQLDIRDYTMGQGNLPGFLDHQKALSIWIKGRYLGYLGVLSTDVVMPLSFEYEPSVFELDFDVLSGEYKEELKFTSIPKYPGIQRDLAIVIDEKVRIGDIIDTIKVMEISYLVDIDVFDVYRGEPIPPHEKGIALRLEFLNYENTLSDVDIDPYIEKILQVIKERWGGEIRS